MKGPADRLLRGLGVEVSARGVATLYRDLVSGYLMDEKDAALAANVEALGLRTRVVDTLMRGPEVAASLARAALELARSLS